MAFHNPTSATYRRPAPQVARTATIPGPVLGIDARTILSEGNPNFCIYSFNLVPAEYGLKVRSGYREWAIELNNGSGVGVRTIIPFGGDDDDASDDRLFAVTNEGIWNVSTYAAAPVFVLDFSNPVNGGITGGDAGRGVYTQLTTDAGDKMVFYADAENGLFTYDAVSDIWSRASGFTGVTIEDVVFVTTHKDQLWMFERDSSVAFYLAAGAIMGAATAFYFGSKFKHGGNLAGLFVWTIDGGSGVDDLLVAVSRAGDVIPYQGTDPSSADTWGSVGQYFIGAVPAGHRFANGESGNLYLLSIFGLISMQELIRGVYAQNIRENTETLKIAQIIRPAMDLTRNDFGWDVLLLPSIGSLVIGSPKILSQDYVQYVTNTTNGGWGLWRDVPLDCCAEWSGKIYIGDSDNRVLVMDVDIDNSLITPPEEGANGDAVNWSILTTFQSLGQPALFKRGQYVRAQFLAAIKPNSTSNFRYDFDLSEVLNTASSSINSSSLWDFGLWDSAVWGADTPTGQDQLQGGWGMGRSIAIATSGNSRVETTLIHWDVVYDSGAPL